MYSSPAPIENFEALEFKNTIEKQMEKIEAKLYANKKAFKNKSISYDEHNVLFRRKNYLKRMRSWLEDCLQDLDDIHKGVPWKHIEKVGYLSREKSPDWYEWRDPKEERPKKEVAIPVGHKKTEQKEEIPGPSRCMKKVSKAEALAAMGYDENFIAALGLTE